MSPVQLRETCDALLQDLDELESLLSHLPKDVWGMVYTCIAHTKELKHIATYETHKRATPEQVQHVMRIHNLVDNWFSVIPTEVRKRNTQD
jgi:hypothetical protein